MVVDDIPRTVAPEAIERMDDTEQLTAFDAVIRYSDDDVPYIELPAQIVAENRLPPGTSVRVAVFDAPPADEQAGDDGESGPPVRPGEFHELEIEEVGEQGDGLAFVDGFAVFVPETTPGEQVVVEITEVEASYAFGEVRGV